MEFAVIQTGGKQYIVKAGDIIKVEKLSGYDAARPLKGDKIIFKEVLLVDDGDSTTVGAPFIEGAVVTGALVMEGRNRTVTTMKYKSKVRYRNKKGHRQHFSQVKIESIK
ncbi:MAG: 50S ribosomal protein L21 [Candidatus Vogelbacteria bacterium]|nr:50S ribosomal protein L21 [Candidatus Vogelbacteria bacterium]